MNIETLRWEIAGIMNSRVTLHNSNYIVKNDIHIGDTIKIMRAGDIIPTFVSIDKNGKNRFQPDMTHCPGCGEPTEFDGKNEWCRNDNCNGTLLHQVHDSIVRIGLGGVGVTTLKKIMEKNEITSLYDVLDLSPSQIAQVDGFAEVPTEKLRASIQHVKQTPIEDWRVLSSLNISGIGRRMSKKILEGRTLNELRKMSKDELFRLDDIGEIRAPLIRLILLEKSDYLDALISLFPAIINTVDQKKETLGMVCFTGSTSKEESRDKFWKPMAENFGFEVSKRVSKDLTILVTSDVNWTSNKMKQARKFGIEIMDYDDFRAKCKAA